MPGHPVRGEARGPVVPGRAGHRASGKPGSGRSGDDRPRSGLVRVYDKGHYRGLERFDTMGSALERHVAGRDLPAVREDGPRTRRRFGQREHSVRLRGCDPPLEDRPGGRGRGPVHRRADGGRGSEGRNPRPPPGPRSSKCRPSADGNPPPYPAATPGAGSPAVALVARLRYGA